MSVPDSGWFTSTGDGPVMLHGCERIDAMYPEPCYLVSGTTAGHYYSAASTVTGPGPAMRGAVPPRGHCKNCAAPSTGWRCDYCGGYR